MSNGFYPTSNEILKLDIDYTSLDLGKKKNQNLLDILFNHYLMRKENLSRIQSELKTGYLELSNSTIAKDFNISKRVVNELLKRFTDKNILLPVMLSDKKGQASVYAYSTVVNLDINVQNSEPNFEPNFEPNKTSISNVYKVQSEPNFEPNFETSKKEKIKTKTKKLCKKEDYQDIINNFTKNETIRELLVEFTKSMHIRKRTLTNKALKLHLKDLELFSNNDEDTMIQIIENTIKNSYNAFYKPKNTPKGKSNANFTETYVYDDDLDERIEKSQRKKYQPIREWRAEEENEKCKIGW